MPRGILFCPAYGLEGYPVQWSLFTIVIAIWSIDLEVE